MSITIAGKTALKITEIFDVEPPVLQECEYCSCITTKVEYYKKNTFIVQGKESK